METLLWIFQIALAVLFAFTGLLKVTRTREELAPRMGWVVDATDAQVKTVGVLELMAAVGLVLPAALGIVPVLTALAAVGVILLMAGAARTHASMNELNRVPITVVIAAMAALIAVGRFS